jgi:threonine/homoserine/homoserine lactone efflux protein
MLIGIDHLGLFIVAGLLLNLTPGPDVLYILTHAVKSGWRTGAVAAAGITAGCFVHIAAAALGVSALMAASSTAFTALKWLGAAYLVYVGWSMLDVKGLIRSKRAVVPGADSGELVALPAGMRSAPEKIASCADSIRASGLNHLKDVFLKGFWTNALNPKVALFFLAFLPQFIAPGASSKTGAFLLLGLIFNFNAFWVNLAYAVAGAAVSQRFSVLQSGMRWLERVAGVLFLGFGLKLALTDNPIQ